MRSVPSFALLLLALCALPSAALEVVGFGSATTGGEGLPTIAVTTLEDRPSDGSCSDGTCTIRDAHAVCLAQAGGRIVFPGLSGELVLSGENLTWTCSNATIDGSTAANRGIQILGKGAAGSNMFLLDADNVILTQLRFRCSGYSGSLAAPGCVAPNRDVLAIIGGTGIVIDHVSSQWTRDGLLDIGDGRRAVTDVTVQHSLLAENLGSGASLVASGATRVTFYRNAFINNSGRNPALSALRMLYGVSEQRVELVENFAYNFIYGVEAQPGTGLLLSLVARGNVWQRGPAGDTNEKIPVQLRRASTGRAHLFADRNHLLDGAAAWASAGNGSYDVASTENANAPSTWPTTSVASCAPSNAPCAARATQTPTGAPLSPDASAEQTRRRVLAEAGATRPCRDDLDLKVIGDATNLTGPSLVLQAPTTSLPALTGPCP